MDLRGRKTIQREGHVTFSKFAPTLNGALIVLPFPFHASKLIARHMFSNRRPNIYGLHNIEFIWPAASTRHYLELRDDVLGIGRPLTIIVDDHSVMHQALAALLSLSEDIEVVGEAQNGRMALALARRLWPDVVLMDIEMPEIDGTKGTRLLRLENPHIKVIGLSMHEKSEVEQDFLNSGASVFLMKNAPSSELMRAIRTVHALWHRLWLARSILNAPGRGSAQVRSEPRLLGLTQADVHA
jgi:CheY-like chemotaxis protein